MPFTLSHAAAALPFRKLKPIWPALVIGTFAPDLQYFIWISDEDRSGHRFPDVALVTLPLALILLWVFERYVKGPAIELLPSAVQHRLQNKLEPLSFRGWKRLASIVLWMAVGITTHVFWDSFTHSHTWPAEHWSLLWYTVPVPFHTPVPLLKLLQYVSTLLGLLILGTWFLSWYRKAIPVPRASLPELSPFRKLATVLIMALVAVLAGYPLAIFQLSDRILPIRPIFFAVTVFEAITLVFSVQLLAYSLARIYATRSRRVPVVRMDEQHS